MSKALAKVAGQPRISTKLHRHLKKHHTDVTLKDIQRSLSGIGVSLSSIWGQVLKYQFFQFIDSQKNNAELKGKAKAHTPVRNLFDTTPLIKYIPTSFDVLRW